MSTSKLDNAVKGAVSPAQERQIAPAPSTSGVNTSPQASSPTDPLASLPSSPPQIYLNLIILEASLRAQYLELRGRRRQHSFFLTLLGLWIAYFGYALFLAPREDGSGVGGSVYWVVEVTEKVALMGGIVTGILVWGTGSWERGMRWPRRWVAITNRGLRVFNLKVVVTKRSWWKEWLDFIYFILQGGLWRGLAGNTYHYIDASLISSDPEKGGRVGLPNIHEEDLFRRNNHKGHEEDLTPGGNVLSVLLLPKPFSPTFRENWDIYRNEYWERENERRRVLLQRVRDFEKVVQRKQKHDSTRFPWLLPFARKRGLDVEKSHHSHHHHHHHSQSQPYTKVGLSGSEKKTRPVATTNRSGSHSRNSSRASTPSLEPEDRRPPNSRRGSNASTASVEKRKKAASGSSSASERVKKLTPTSSSRLTGTSASASRTSIPNLESAAMRNPLMRENSFNSVSSLDIDVEQEQSIGPDGEARTRRRAGSGGLGKTALPANKLEE